MLDRRSGGDWSGFGRLTYHRTKNETPDILYYQGGFLDNRKHGLGVIRYSDGRVYDGTFQLDQMGKGKMTYVDGSIYWGYWSEEGERHGRGKLTYSDSSVYDGEFENGSTHGHGKLTLANGQWYLGEWVDGKKHGIGLEVRADGNIIHEGTFCNGRPVRCSSFPRRRRSTGTQLLYRLAAARDFSSTTLVGPLPSHVTKRRPASMMNASTVRVNVAVI